MKLGDIAKESKTTFKGDKTNVPIVGLENIEPEELVLHDYDINTENTFSRSFHKGQILFGRRRAYLKKAAVADFDGICSGDIIIIEPIEGKVEPSLLPFIIQNVKLFNYAVSRSAGGLSPRVKWQDLANYEFSLPPLSEQKSLAEKLWAAYHLKESYKKLLQATDDMVKAEFRKRFGTLKKPKVDIKSLRDISMSSGIYGSNTSAVEYMDGLPRYIRITDINEDGSLNDDVKSAEVIDDKYSLKLGDILFARTGATVGKTYLHKGGYALYAGYLIKYQMNPEFMRPSFLMAFTHSKSYYKWVLSSQKVGAQPNISAKQYDQMPVLVPSLSEQDAFLKVYEQANITKSSLHQSINNIDKVIKSMLNN